MMYRICSLTVACCLVLSVAALAQQPGMNPVKPLGVKPFNLGNLSDVEQVEQRTLAVLMEQENEMQLKNLNRNLRFAVDSFWHLPVKEIKFMDNYEVQGLIDTKDTNHVILQCPDRVLTITELPEEKAPTTLGVRKMELFLAENRRRIGVVRMSDVDPSRGEMVIALKQIQKFLMDRSGKRKGGDVKREIRDNRKKLKQRILLIDQDDFINVNDIDMDELKMLYTDSVMIVEQAFIDSVILAADGQYAFVQMVHYMRTQSLHYMVDAQHGAFMGYFRTRNSLGDYLNYQQHVKLNHVKKYAELAGRSFADIFSKRFAMKYGTGIEVGLRMVPQATRFRGKSYDNKTEFRELVETQQIVVQEGTTEYVNTTGMAYGITFTSMFDTLFNVTTGFYVSYQGQDFAFTHFDNRSGKEVTRDIQFKLKYYKIPFLVNVNTGNDKPFMVNAFAGPQVGVLAYAMEYIDGRTYPKVEQIRSFKNKHDHATFESSFKSIDYQLVLGASLQYKLYNNMFLNAGFRWDRSILDADSGFEKDKSVGATRNTTYGSELGLNFVF